MTPSASRFLTLAVALALLVGAFHSRPAFPADPCPACGGALAAKPSDQLRLAATGFDFAGDLTGAVETLMFAVWRDDVGLPGADRLG